MIVGVSIGRAAFPHDAQTAEQLLTTADAAMFAHQRRHSGVV
jgi:predicted signal transduction protein with EAL and GGDEF domain